MSALRPLPGVKQPPLPAVFGYKGHSLVFETGETIPAEALFLEYREASGEILTPELFPRADGTTWVCATGDYKFRTKTAKYRALEKNARRERISDLSASLTVQRFAD